MEIERVYWLREFLVMNAQGQEAVAMEFSYDSGALRTPRFYDVTEQDLPRARALYLEWGGNRAEGFRSGTTVGAPLTAAVQPRNAWRRYG